MDVTSDIARRHNITVKSLILWLLQTFHPLSAMPLYTYTHKYTFTYTYTYMHTRTINDKRSHEFEGQQELYERIWKKEREARNVAMIL